MADTNWIATASPIVNLGAKPVFVDILEDSWCIDPEKAEAAITPKTKAIVAVHIYGNFCDMDALLAIGEKYGIPVIEDAAEAIGSIYHGKRAGSMGKFGTFSFHGTKTLTTGEGGMFVTNDADLFERVLTLSNHGRARGQTKQFWPDMVGFKYKMSNIQAAIGCAQMERIDDLINRKRDFCDVSNEICSPKGAEHEPRARRHCKWCLDADGGFLIRDRDHKERLQREFVDENVDARVFFWPLSSLPMFEAKKRNHNSWSIPGRTINLPSYNDIDAEDIERVVSVINCVID